MNNKKIWVGFDIGATSVKASIATEDSLAPFKYQRLMGKPIEVATNILEEIQTKYGKDNIDTIVVTGSGGKTFAEKIDAVHINEFQAITLAVQFLYPEVKTVLEIGGQTSKYILLDENGIVDYGVNGDCAAGTGSFIDQQAARLHYKVEDIGDIVEKSNKAARIAGRCSVFAKSDMIHAQQMGYEPGEILNGLCLAVARNFNATILKGRKIEHPAIFIGGVSLNSAMVASIKDTLKISDKDLIIPKNSEYISSIGTALFAKRELKKIKKYARPKKETAQTDSHLQLSTENVTFLRDKVSDAKLEEGKITDIYMGIDIGSVSTNFVLINKDGDLVHEIYTMTKSRPIEVVSNCLKEIEEKFGNKINIKAVGTTGSGRELIGELIGADTIRDEITSHKTGALHISRTMTDREVDTIFEIGGQDSKFIRIENGIVVDFTMNEACAAGTGSFLEEQAEKLGISIKEEFANEALSSTTPLKLGERCTVFMERDVSAYQMIGSEIKDIVSGLAYSVVLNYLNRVVRGRNIGETIFFQGGTAYNDAVAAAFAKVLNKKIIVPPHNGVIGAVGVGLLAKEKIEASKANSTFKGFDIGKIDYKIREFTCKACTNECDIQEFTVEGSKTYWGDKCSSKYRKKTKVDGKTILADLFEEREKLLLENYNEKVDPNKKTIGIPRAMYFYDRFPFWNAYMKGIGFNVVLSDETNKKIVEAGITSRVSEPCHPIGVAHGHVQNLLDKKVDYVWIPNILTAEPNGQEHVRPYLCPWGMTLPYMIESSPKFEPIKDMFIKPTLHHLHGDEFLSKQLFTEFKKLGVKKGIHKKAFKNALGVQNKFRSNLKTLGEMALHKLDELDHDAVVLVGRPYNLFDRHVNLNVPTKLRSSYGVDVIPYDILPAFDIPIEDVADQMFWNYGKKILSASKYIGKRNHLHMIYITNFKCGPDSFVKHFAKEACGKPYLALQFDEHSNDAGVMTRIEAYLDSKGLLNKVQKGTPKKEKTSCEEARA